MFKKPLSLWYEMWVEDWLRKKGLACNYVDYNIKPDNKNMFQKFSVLTPMTVPMIGTGFCNQQSTLWWTYQYFM